MTARPADLLYAREGYYSRTEPDRMIWALGYASPGRARFDPILNSSNTAPLRFRSYLTACRFAAGSYTHLPPPIRWGRGILRAPHP
tara:strand:- start:33326 stop:33583 length:258 start_codon:yes stop_codon:yes gene_type:complete